MIKLMECERELTKFERENLIDFYFNEAEFKNPSKEGCENWIESLSWSEIDDITSHYTNENE